MTRFQILNSASELRRAANWLGRNQNEKFHLVKKILNEESRNPKVKKILIHFKADKYPSKNNHRFLGEQLLVSSIRLQNSA